MEDVSKRLGFDILQPEGMIEHPGKQENGTFVRVFSVSSGNVVSALLESNGTFLGNAVNALKALVTGPWNRRGPGE